jgi:hypothetical protein
MERVEIKTSLTLADWQAYQAHSAQRILGGQRTRIAGVLLAVGAGLAAALLAHFLGRSLSMPSLIGGVILGAVGASSALRARRKSQPDSDSFVLGPSSIVISAAGIEVIKAGMLARYAWSVVRELECTDQYLFVWMDRMAAIIVPLRDLPAGLDATQLRHEIRGFRDANSDSTAEPATVRTEEAPRSAEETTPRQFSPLRRFMRAYGSLLIGRTPDANDLAIPSRLALLLPTAGFAICLIVDRWRAGTDATFYPYGVFVWSWYTVALLAAVWAAARLAQPRVAYERVLVLTAVFTPFLLLLDLAQDLWVRPEWVLVTSLVIAVYAGIYVSRALRSLTGYRQVRAAWTFGMILFVAFWATQSMYASGSFWYPNDEGEEDGSDSWADMSRSEALLYAQPKRIAAAVAALQRPDDLPAAAFFVGFAGQGEQRVFASEISLARKVFADKFGSAQRSVLLVNDRRDL